jgi:formamidopyrimidine-DNA glycosylase
MLGRVGLTNDAEAFFRDHNLGIDALDPSLDRRAFVALVAGAQRGAKAALINQSVIAGIGNIYSDEILFQAHLHPKARLDALDDAALARLYEAMRRVLEVAISRGAGSEELLDRLPRGYLLPHRGKGGECPRCGAPLAALKLGARTSWFCPRCQPTPHRERSLPAPAR